jgi:hypothetical protein
MKFWFAHDFNKINPGLDFVPGVIGLTAPNDLMQGYQFEILHDKICSNQPETLVAYNISLETCILGVVTNHTPFITCNGRT